VEIRDLDVGQAGENGGNMRQVHYNLFGLEYEIGVLPTTGDYLYFTNSAKRPEGRFYNVYKYFHHIPNSTGMKINQTHNFTNTLDGMIDYERINVSVYSPAAEAALRQEGTNAPALILNAFMADGKGRTAWMSAPESGRPLTEDDVAVLVKSLVIWASGESYDVVPGIAASNPSRAVLYKVYNRDMVQPVEVSLSVGSIY
jgi:hypothetical protein